MPDVRELHKGDTHLAAPALLQLRAWMRERDSGVGPDRADAHRFYFRHGLRIASYHFARRL